MAQEFQRCSKSQKLDNSVSGTATFRQISDSHRQTFTTKLANLPEYDQPTIPPLAPLPLSNVTDFDSEPTENDALAEDETTQVG